MSRTSTARPIRRPRLKKLAAHRPGLPPRRLRQAAARRARHRHLQIRRHRPELCRPRQGNRHADPDRADLLPEGQHRAVAARTTRSKSRAARPSSTGKSKSRAIIGTRAKYVSRSRRAEPCRRLLRLQRRLRAQFPDRAPRPVDQGQVARHVRPGRPLARHQGRDRRRAEARRCGSTSTASAARPASTSTMIFTMAKCISYVSQFLTLLPGDIITTGTPPGVGTGMKPPTLPQCRRRRDARHRRPRRAAPGNRRGVKRRSRITPPSLRAKRSNPVATRQAGLLRRFAPRNDERNYV